jgi:hypothetical protein
MTTAHHTPIAFGAPRNAAVLEAPLGQLDAAIATVIATGSGVSTTLTAQANAGQASLTVASSAGFAPGDPIYIGTGATFESQIVNTVPGGGVTITVTVNLTNTYAIGKPVSKSPVEIVDARSGSISLKAQMLVIGRAVYDVKAYGALGDGATNDATAFQAALDAVVSSGKEGVVLIPTGRYKINTGLTVNASFASIIGHGAVLDVAAITGGPALTIRGTVASPFLQNTQRYEGFRLAGPGKASAGSVGIYLHESTASPSGANGPSEISFKSLVVRDFQTGIKFGDGAYHDTFTDVSVSFCATCVSAPASPYNGGELLTFSGCRFHSSDLAVSAKNANGGMHFVASAFDYNAKQFDIADMKVSLTNCHVEAGVATYTSAPITVAGDGGMFTMVGGWFLQTGAGPASNSYVVDCAATGGGAYFAGVFFNNNQTATRLFGTGTGSIELRNCFSTDTSLNPRHLSTAMNRLADGGFEQTSVVDEVFIYADTAGITDRVTGANIALTTSTTEFRSGARSLKAQKTGGGASNADFIIAIPIQHGAHPAMQLWYRKPGAQTGTMYIDTAFARLGVNGSGVPVVIYKAASISSVPVVFSAAAVAWTVSENGEPSLRAPAWATHFIVIVNLTSFVGAGPVYFDDVLLTEM